MQTDAILGMDELKKRKNIDNDKPLCPKCEGTGNQFYFMYSKCPDCDGTGIDQHPAERGEGERV